MPRSRPPRPSLPEAARLFRLLGGPTRLRLVLLLADRGEASVNDLAGAVGRPQPTVSNQLGLLRRCRVVDCRRITRGGFARHRTSFYR